MNILNSHIIFLYDIFKYSIQMRKNKNKSNETSLKPILSKKTVPVQAISTKAKAVIHKKKYKASKNNKYMFGLFHEHFNPWCETSVPIYDLSIRAHGEMKWAMSWNEHQRRFHYKKILRAIPGMSTVLGDNQWSYSDSYSPKQATDIYIYFLSVFIQKHPVDYKSKKQQCKNCRSMISYEAISHHAFALGPRGRCVNYSHPRSLSLREKRDCDRVLFFLSETEITKRIADATKSVKEIRSFMRIRSASSTRSE